MNWIVEIVAHLWRKMFQRVPVFHFIFIQKQSAFCGGKKIFFGPEKKLKTEKLQHSAKVGWMDGWVGVGEGINDILGFFFSGGGERFPPSSAK